MYNKWLIVAAVLVACTAAALHSTQPSTTRWAFVLHSANPTADATLEELFWNVSTPGHVHFRQFVDVPFLTAVMQAEARHIEALKSLFTTHPVLSAKPSQLKVGVCKDILFAELPSHVTKQDIETVFAALEHQGSIRVKRFYKVKAAHRVSSYFVEKKQPKPKAPKGQFPGMTNTIFDLRARYNIPLPSTIPSSSPALQNYSQAVAEFEQEQFYPSNIATFNEKYGLPSPNLSVKGPNKGGYFGEGNLDLEYLNGLTPVVKTWWVADKEFDVAHFVETLLEVVPHPSVVSISWGGGESGYEASQIAADNTALKKLGSLGISALSASGDQGTGSTGFFSCGTFDPTWPASSQYVTAVGACYTNSNTSAQIGWAGSGGGFSTLVTMPSYQADAVKQYYASNATLPDQKYWTRGGRATPDVSSLGTNFEVYSSGWGTETGTSAATPTFAAVISRINIARLLKGESTLGFLNPMLYKLGRVGEDVVSGENTNPSCPSGFQAAAGWDPVTGLGTPDYTFLEQNL